MKILVLLWTLFLWGFWFVWFPPPRLQGQELLCESLISLYIPVPVPCVVPSCFGDWGTLNAYLLPNAAGKLIFYSHFCENCFWYPYSSVGLWGSQECSLSSCAWNGVVIVAGSPPLSLPSLCCSSLFSTHALSACFVLPLLHSLFSSLCSK